MDFVTHLPTSKGLSVILVVVDRLTKYGHFSPIAAGFTAASVARVFVRDICRLHGMPNNIVSDRDPIFMSSFWKELFQLQGTRLTHSSAYHPQTDGQTEVLNRILEDYLRFFVNDNQTNWPELLPWAELHYNTAHHSATQLTPFEAVYGHAPLTLKDYSPGSSPVAAIDQLLTTRTHLISQLKDNLARARLRMTQQANKHRKDVEFKEGDWVYVKLHPYRQTSGRNQRCSKLAKRYYGPFQISARVGNVAYRLALPANAKIHNVFHISVLKLCRAPNPQDINWPDCFTNEHPTIQPDQILDRRKVQRNNIWIEQILVRWRNQPNTDATWEDCELIHHQYPDFNLEVEVVSEEGGIVTVAEDQPMLGKGARQRSKPKRDAAEGYSLFGRLRA
ncbi:unnamed protein product [Rhodiola kirilowii]